MTKIMISEYTAIIIEDEISGIEILEIRLKEYCPEIKLLTTCQSGEEGILAIQKFKPQIVFLDIHLGQTSGFEVLDQVQYINFEVIFITSHNEYAIQAIKANAIDYLLKPFETQELVNAVNKATEKIRSQTGNQKLTKISVPIRHGFKFIGVDEIIHCEADSNYADIHLFNKQIIHVTRTLSKIEEKLANYRFFRIHQSFLINLDYIESYERKDGGYVLMENGKRLRISNKYKEEFLKLFGG